MISDITAAISILKSLRDVNKGLSEIKTNDAVREKSAEMNFLIIDLQNALMAVQEQNQTLSRINDDLAKQLAEIDEWERESKNDSLSELAPDVFVYVREAPGKSSNPTVYLCTNCYRERKASIMQRVSHQPEGVRYRCPACKMSIVDHGQSYNPFGSF
jgi:hypothetical protein